METGSKVSELVAELRTEESRLKAEIAQARKNVRQFEKELTRLRAGIRSLTGASKSGKKKSSSPRRKSSTQAVGQASGVINAPREYRYEGGGGEPDGPAAPESQQVEESVFEGCL